VSRIRFGVVGLLAATAMVASPALAAPASASTTGTAGGRSAGQTRSVDQDISAALSTVQGYWRSNFQANGVAFRPIKRVIPYTPKTAARVSTACGPGAPGNAFYCSLDDTIAYDRTFMATMSHRMGNAFIFMVIGHEYGHRIQFMGQDTNVLSIQLELQADCLSGAYIGDSVRGGVLELEPGDIQRLERSVRAGGDPEGYPWFAPDAHGSGQQRFTAFAGGYNHGLDAC
jgi:predicted metalloprotease